MAHTSAGAYTPAMSRLAVILLTLALGACASCSKSKAHQPETGGEGATKAPPPQGTGDEVAVPEGSSDSFNMTLDQPQPVAPGAAATLRITVVPTAGYHINQDFPTKLTLEPPSGITLGKTTLALEDAEKVDDHQLVFAVQATPAAAGSFTVPGKIKFAVCKGEEDCEPKRRPVSFTVAAQ